MTTNDAPYLKLLQNQLALVDERDFNLASWKKSTILLVSTCFGANSEQVSAIEKIDYNYSSWALRDESGASNPILNECKATLSTIISQYQITIETLDKNDSSNQINDLDFLWTPFQDELTGASVKRLKSILNQASVSSEEVEIFLKDLPNQTLVNIIQSALTSKEFKQWISQQ